jgi:hypothetical protein
MTEAARDPVVWIGGAFGVAATAYATLADRYVPYIDWANHLGLISVLAHGGNTGALELFERSFAPSPYLAFYALSALFAQVFSVDVAARIVLAIAGGCLALGASALAAATGRSARLGLIGPLAMFGTSSYWGFGSFLIATPVLLFSLASAERALHAARLRSRESVIFAIWLALLYLSHGLLFVAGVLAIGVRASFFAIARARQLGWRDAARAPLILVAASLPSIVLMLPAFLALMTTPSIEKGSESLTNLFEFRPLDQRIARLPNDLLDQGSGHHRTVMWCALALLAVWLLFSIVRALRDRNRGLEIHAALFAALYFFGPMTINWPSSIWMLYPRFGVIAALLILLLPRCDLRGTLGAVLALPALVLVGANAELNARHVRTFSSWSSRYDQVRALIPPRSRVLALTAVKPNEPQLVHHSIGSLFMYHMVDGASYVSYLFDKNELPVHLRRDRPIPRAPHWANPWAFDPHTHGADYDYLVLRGGDLIQRTQAAGLHEKIAQIENWAVFRTRIPPARTPP